MWVQFVKVKVLVAQSCLILCHHMDCSPPGSSVHGILQARILEWVAIPFPNSGIKTRSPGFNLKCLFMRIIFNLAYSRRKERERLFFMLSRKKILYYSILELLHLEWWIVKHLCVLLLSKWCFVFYITNSLLRKCLV